MMNFAKFLTWFRAAWALFALCASMAAAAGEHGVSFWHKDWEIVCDNTLTCRMAGYSDESDDEWGSVLITRAAGPDTPLQGKVTLADYDNDESANRPRTLTLWIDGKSLGKLTDIDAGYNYSLKPAQIRALLIALKGTGKIAFTGEKQSFVLSTAGASAVMLKMDEVQGRIGTPGALVRSGKKPEENVYPARPAPVIQAAKVSDVPPRKLTAPEIAALKPLLLKTLSEEECYRMEDGKFTLTPLDAKHVLISAPCWLAAYNDGDAWWVIDSALKGQPELITSAANDYKKGVLSGSHKSRGLGDCWYGQTWVWDGRTFRQSEESSTGMCRGIHAGGTWDLPTFVTKVKPAE
jgi:hypothetical protein